jgi:hypothetical protein
MSGAPPSPVDQATLKPDHSTMALLGEPWARYNCSSRESIVRISEAAAVAIALEAWFRNNLQRAR